MLLFCCLQVADRKASTNDDDMSDKNPDRRPSNDLFDVHDFNIDIDLNVPSSGTYLNIIIMPYVHGGHSSMYT